MARRTSSAPTPTGVAPQRPAASARTPSGTPAAASMTRAAEPRREPTADDIRRRAYEIYLERRGVGGSPEARPISRWAIANRVTESIRSNTF